MAGIPGEPTTMAGRRIKDVVGNALVQNGLEPRVAVSALTNEYIHYVSTFEEYQVIEDISFFESLLQILLN